MKNPIQLLKEGVNIFKENPTLFIGIMLVPMILSVLASWLEPSRATGVIDTTEWVVYGVVVFVSVIFSILMGVALTVAVDNRAIGVVESYKVAKSFFWKYLLFSIVMSIMIFVGFLLLIIPGIILSVWFVFSTFVLVLERSTIKEAFKRSREYVRGKWWAVFGRIFFISVISILIIGILGGLLELLSVDKMLMDVFSSLISIVIAPIALAYMYVMYKEVSANNPVTDSSSPVVPETDVTPVTPSENM